ncbi:MAG: hypothetical protein KBS53_04865 [Bacteroidales bacterium]|nr:hypothetical protein [Candidatus Hennigimonas equi]
MKRPNPHTLSPDFRSREHQALVRKNRVVVLLNDMEATALKRYQSVLKGKAKSVICREAIMEKVIKGLDENQPTLF